MRIDIWCAFCDSVTDSALLQRYRSVLTDTERNQEVRFHFAEDRHRYLITRALLRTTLSRYADMPPERWTFVANAHGRPSVSNDGVHGLRFNLSHTRKLVVLAVARNCELGVDTEDTLARAPALELADRFFAREEASSLRALPPEGQPELFFRYWTLKESYIKALGRGLSLPLGQFAFDFPEPDRIRLTLRPQIQDCASNWRFWQWWVESRETDSGASPAPSRRHMLALCAQRVGDESVQLVMREIVPFVSESELRTTLIAATPV